MSFVRPTPEEAAASLGFNMGHACAIRAPLPQGKTPEAMAHQMAQDERLLVVGLPHLRALFRQHWRKGYHYWHVYVLAKEFFERASPDAQLLVHVRTRQEGDDEHDPWVSEFLCQDSVSGETLLCTVEVGWIPPVNGWMVIPTTLHLLPVSSDEQDAVLPPQEGISMRVLPCCGNTLLQITCTMSARFMQFTHSTEDGTDRCPHLLKPGVQSQAVLRDGEIGTISVEMGPPDDPQKHTITFRVLDVELAEIDNPLGLPLHVEVVL